MSCRVLIIPEDPTYNGYILAPLISRMLKECGKGNAKVKVLTNPRVSGFEHAWRSLPKIVDAYSHFDLLLFLPDADGEDRTQLFRRLEAHPKLICCAAVEEVEAWLLAGHVDQLPCPWPAVRADASVKENVFAPFLADHGDPRSPGGGRERLMQKTLTNYRGPSTAAPNSPTSNRESVTHCRSGRPWRLWSNSVLGTQPSADPRTPKAIKSRTEESTMLGVGESFPNYSLTATVSLEKGKTFQTISDSDFPGQWKVYFFWPKDFTFVCPTEISAFGDLNEEFKKRNAKLLGGSVDSEFVHLAWRQHHPDLKNLPCPMLADIKHELCAALGILDPKAGVAQRATFIVDPEGIIRFVLVNDLSVGRNPQEVLRVLDALQTGDLTPCNWHPGQAVLQPSI